MATPARIDYKTAMRSAIDARHQPGDVKDPGKAGSQQHVRGAGIGNEQNKLAPSEAGTGSRSGAKGGPSEHPQNLVHATAAGSPTPTAASPLQGGRPGSTGENVGIGPRAVGPADESVPHAGQGNDATGVGFKAAPGGPVTHPQNLVSAGGDGEGADGKGFTGGGAQKRGGHAQNRVLLVKAKHNTDPGGEQPKKSLAGAIKRPGALTRAVGGKPSQKPGKVRALAAHGTPLQKKQASYYLNVLAGH